MGARPHIVIVGGGFAGLYAARSLRRADADITLVDQHNYHLFQPLLYQVATAALNPADIAAPIRRVLRHQPNAEVLLGRAVRVDVERRVLVLEDAEVTYDQLVLATGVTDTFFGHDDWARYAAPLKTVPDALAIRARVLYAFEAAEREPDEARRRAWLTFVIVGGGPTGVELAGALAEIARYTLERDFRHIDSKQARVILVEGQPQLLPSYPAPLPASAARQLGKLGVVVRTSTKVTHIDADGVRVSAAAPNGAEEENIAARTVLWAAGVKATPIAGSLGVPLDRAGRVRVAPDLTVPGHPEISIAGDLALVDGPDGKPVPGVAPAAIQMGRHVGKNLLATLRGRPRQPFKYFDKGSLAVIGRGRAVAHTGPFKLSGLLAWWAWLLVHVYFLIGFRNRLLVLLEWAWAYLTFDRGARLITAPAPPKPSPASLSSPASPPSPPSTESRAAGKT